MFERLITHAGIFHADDVLSAALLEIIADKELPILRVEEVPETTETDIVFDIGGGEFDHHDGSKKKYRPSKYSGKQYASFGLLWNKFGNLLVDEVQVKAFDLSFVQKIDDNDCNGGENAFAKAILSFNPNWDSNDDPDIAFREAVNFSKILLRKEIARMKSASKAYPLVKEAYLNTIKTYSESIGQTKAKRFCILDKYIPFNAGLAHSDCWYVIYPSSRSDCYCIGVTMKNGKNAICFPKTWATENKPEEIIFCHPSRFLVTTKDKESAIKLIFKLLGEEI